MSDIIIPNTSLSTPRFPLGSPNTSIIPSAGGAARPMRNVTKAAGKGAGNLAKAGKVAVVAKTAYDLGRLALSEQAREEEAARVAQMAEDSDPASRFVTGLLDPVNTAYGIGRLIQDTLQAERDAAEAEAAAPSYGERAAAYLTNKKKREQEKSFREAADEKIGAVFNETIPSLDGPMRAITSDNKSIFDTMPKLNMGTYQEPEAASQIANSISEMAAEERPMEKGEKPMKAQPVYDEGLVDSLFKTTHGTSIDPNSKLDLKKKKEIESMLGEMGGQLGKVTPNQFALQIYRKFKYL
jgi:hypothetical protein